MKTIPFITKEITSKSWLNPNTHKKVQLLLSYHTEPESSKILTGTTLVKQLLKHNYNWTNLLPSAPKNTTIRQSLFSQAFC